MRKKLIKTGLWLFALSGMTIGLLSCANQQNESIDQLYAEFLNPPQSAKPRVWWHWMNGNVTQDGIRKDLAWMDRVGIGGFQNFDAALMTPQIVEKRLTYMTPEWKDAFQLTAHLADSLKLEMAIAGSPGWSESGGPWVAPEDGMKKLVWTETRVKGGTSGVQLPKPSDITGPFQNIQKQPEFGVPVDMERLPSYYKDVAVVAFKVPEADLSLKELGAKVTSSGGHFTIDQLTDGDLATAALLPNHSSGKGWIQFAFPQAQTIKAITMVGGGEPGMFGNGATAPDARQLEASNDGVNFDFVCNIPAGAILQQTIAIPETTANYFRVTVNNPPPKFNPLAAAIGMDVKPEILPGTEIAEIVLHPADVINCFEEKAAFAPVDDLSEKLTAKSEDTVDVANVLDLTAQMNADGTLNWEAPEGEWKILRLGYSLMGIENHPASPEATGLEVDKLDPDAIRRYFTNYLDQYKAATGGLMGANGGLQYLVTDSWEAGAQNWTANLPAEFQQRRGYSLIPWMPVLTGAIVKSAEASEQFLFDFRETLSEMVSDYHYDGLTAILNEYGMKRYSESHENGRAMIADGMEVKRTAAVPMAAMWTPGGISPDQIRHEADIRESASVAHIYGQNLVAAESLTALGVPEAAWKYCPENLKPTADLELASGLNRFVIHCSVHQPVDDKIPGLGLGPFGQWFNRHETWAEQAHAWCDYLSRSSYLLQQGHFVADVLYLYGEDRNITALFANKLPDIPEGYNYDFVNADALIHVIGVEDGKLTTKTGTKYRLLVLDESCQQMTLPVLQRINELVQAGATVVGNRPSSDLSLSDDQAEFARLCDELFGAEGQAKTIGSGTVYAGMTAIQALNAIGLTPDFAYTQPQADSELMFVHRAVDDTQIYWVNNRKARTEKVELTFRVDGKTPELWNPETGEQSAVPYTIADGQTTIPLTLTPDDAVFIVFGQKAKQKSLTLPLTLESVVQEIDGPWEVSFQAGRGAPAESTFDSLTSWTEKADAGIKYFSGTAGYKNSFKLEAKQEGSRIVLDLGDVKNLAEVFVNGVNCGIVWKTPFKVDITDAVQTGENQLEVQVTNLWVNRLIGDMQAGVTEKITYTTMPFYKADSSLLPSGLLGPVKLIQIKK
ncbi:glycosyl hydrolase [Mangrovibacterium lignilyticum]|uniref:glycosyl hydrolase n=1 Tax=Mangrovibacterium lignilyticum TaxID=2668052 RepID=UPI0013D6E9F8|nr:glycosyl hydrolase [Mangrovibacterium lignilyticum]